MHVIRASCVYIDSVKGKNRPHRREEASSRAKVTSEAMYVYIYIYIRPNCGLFTLHYVFCLGREVLGMGKGCVTKHVNKHVAATQCPFEHTEAMFVCVCIHVCVHMCESVCVCASTLPVIPVCLVTLPI